MDIQKLSDALACQSGTIDSLVLCGEAFSPLKKLEEVELLLRYVTLRKLDISWQMTVEGLPALSKQLEMGLQELFIGNEDDPFFVGKAVEEFADALRKSRLKVLDLSCCCLWGAIVEGAAIVESLTTGGLQKSLHKLYLSSLSSPLHVLHSVSSCISLALTQNSAT